MYRQKERKKINNKKNKKVIDKFKILCYNKL